jgi:hypothetical protein
MNQPEPDKTKPGKEPAEETQPPRAAEARLLIQQYANDLRELIKKLRGRLN